jgi:hypothetical protein
MTEFQKRAYYMGDGLCNNLPTNVKGLGDDLKLFRPALKGFLHFDSFLYVRGVF